MAVVLACAGLTLLPAIAGAATTIGQTITPTTGCIGNTVVQQSEGAGVPSYAVPAGGGVITSWSTLAASAAGQDMRFKVFRATGTPNQYLVVGADTDKPLTSGVLNTFAVRIPVQAGDRLGAFSNSLCVASSPGSDIQYRSGNDEPGTTNTYSVSGAFVVDASAQVEPDADGDGFGDETQDQCPTDPSTHGPCFADVSIAKTADKATATVGDAIIYSVVVKNNSPTHPATAVSVTDALPANVSLISATASQGSCGGSVTCSLGTIAKTGTATVTVVVRATAPGAANDTASVSSSTADPNTTNNAASAATNIVRVFPGLTLSAKTLTATHSGKVKPAVRCPADALGNCTGRDTLKTAGKVTLSAVTAKKKKRKVLTLGSARFSIAPGKTATVTIKLSKTARALLATKKTLKVLETVVAHDSRNVSKTTSKTITIKAPPAKKKHH